MRIFLCLLGQLNADWYSEFSQPDKPSWDEWSQWSACTNPCGADGTHIRSRQCLGGEPGTGNCKGDQAETAPCSASCFGTCATNSFPANGDQVTVDLDGAPREICFWSEANSPDADGALVSYDIITYSRSAEQFHLTVGDAVHSLPIGRNHAHTCLILSEHAIKVQQDGLIRFYPANGYANELRQVLIGGGSFDGSVSELAVTDAEQDPMIRLAQSAGSACNLNTIANIADFSLAGAWSEWGKCSHNCGSGRSYRFRNDDAGQVIQMFRECNPQPCQPGWTDWSQWTPCDASCGGGSSHRTRTCQGPNKCEGAPHEKKPCNGPDCPDCGYSAWAFPAEQSIANYLMVKPVLTDMSQVSICFAVENGLNELHGTVFSYSRGLDSPRGNELLFLGKDITNDEIRLYRRDEKITIPNDVLSAGEKTNFCITLQSVQGTRLHTSVYVNGFIAASSSEGSVRNGVALSGGGEMIIGQDQDCILGCFNSSQALIGNLYDFSIYDTALNPEQVMNLHLSGECARRPVLSLSKDNAMVYGKPKFVSTWAEFGDWSECSASCGTGYQQRERACLGGKPNDVGCPGSNIEKLECDSGVECPVTSEWSKCSVECGGYGTQNRMIDGVMEEQECGGNACPEVGEWSNWTECSRSCGDGFTYRYRECYNGPCEEATQDTTWCNLSVCVDSWNMPWPCGEVRQAQKSMRIVGGYEAQRAEVPWVCILELRSDPICGASVIAPKWNIGASHCVSQTFDRPEQMRILCGVHDRTITEYGTQTGQVLQYYKHPKYSGSTIDYDLCLFEMKDAWQFTDYVKPVCLPGLHQFPKPGTLCKVAGWGSTHPVAPGHFLWHVEMARSLRAVHVPIIEQAQCAAKYKDQITRRMFCAGYDEGGRDACQGDSGGPIACQIGTDSPPRWQLTGVVSWGIGCAQKNLPGVYTKLAMLTDWIYDYIGSDAGRDPACNVDPLIKSGPRGQFTSPMYNQGGTYGYNMNCHWIIQLNPNKGLLAVTFTKFDLQYSKDCREDALALFGGSNLDMYKGSWCGKSGPSTTVSDNAQSEIKFVLTTNADNRGTTPTGFKAIWAKARLKTQRQAGCAMPVEDFALNGQIRSVQSYSWPLTPPRDSPVTCIVVLRAKKDRATKQLAVPGLFFEDDVDPFCARKMTFFRNSKQLSKFIVNYDQLFEGGSVVHKRPLFQLLFDGRNGGDQCRWKLHYVGCPKNDDKCPDRFRQTVTKVIGQRADVRSGGADARSCSLRTAHKPGHIGLSHDTDSNTRTSLVSMVLPTVASSKSGKPPGSKNHSKPGTQKPKPKKQGPPKGKNRSRRMAKHGKGGKKPKALHCSGSMIGNDRTFVTSAECGSVVNDSWQKLRLGTRCTIGGEEILTRSCKEHPKGNIAVCHLDAAVNPDAVIVPCYPSEDISKDEMLSAESQSNLNAKSTDKEPVVQKTFLPTRFWHERNDEKVVFNGNFAVGFSGAGQNLCNSESGTPIFRDWDGSRELAGIVTSENLNNCQDKLVFTSIVRYNEFIAEQANTFEPEATEFEAFEAPTHDCEPEVNHVFDENCTPITIQSPGYPGLYANNHECKWNFQAPDRHLIKIDLGDIDIESTRHPRKCHHDALVFSQDHKIPVQVCRAYFSEKTITSIKERASLTFKSDSTVTGRGFSATISCVPK